MTGAPTAPKTKPPLAKSSKPVKPAQKSASGKSEPVRRAIAGAPTENEVAHGAESSELALLRAADRELFAPASPPIGVPWPSDLPAPMPIDPSRPVIHASGFPAGRQLRETAPPDLPHDYAWVRALAMPDLPVRWDGRVLRYLDYYRTDPRGRSLAQAWLKKSGRYGTAMRRVLREQGLPEDLLWVSLVESGFEPAIRSPAGAAGLWQLMPDGARIYGLAIDRWIDERLDPERSTEAAARYLADLHRRFGGWELALAAYNMGYGGLLAAIRKYNTNDYWELCRFGVPFETAVYVPKIIAMSVVARNFTPFALEAVKIDPPITFEQVAVPGSVTLRAIAQAAGVDVGAIEALNPQLRAGRTPPDGATPGRVTWSVRVPLGKGAAVTRAVARPSSGSDARRYQTRLGDTFELIAKRQGVSRARLAELNAIRPDEVVRPGTVLLLPAGGGQDDSEPVSQTLAEDKPAVVVPEPKFEQPGTRRVFYRAVTGDSLGEIAHAFAVSEGELCRWNSIDPGARLHDGMTLQVFVPKAADLSGVVHMGDDEVHRLQAGSDEFFAYFEALRGRKRTTVEIQPGDTWDKVGKRYKLSVGQLERINRRWHTEKLIPGETLVVYAPVGRAVVHEASAVPEGPSELPPMVAPTPEDLPSLGDLTDPSLSPVRTGSQAQLR
jgi:membrane-bound lytic murein transglycosylase D